MITNQIFELKDYNSIFIDLINDTNTLPEIKSKDPKAHRYIDIITEAFPTSSYQYSDNQEYFDFKNDKNNNKTIIFKLCLKYLVISSFLKFFTKFLEKFLNEEKNIINLGKSSLINSYYEKNLKNFESFLKIINPSEVDHLLENIKSILQSVILLNNNYISFS